MLTAKPLFADSLLIQTAIYQDSRGAFQETFKAKHYQQLGIAEHFVQDNVSLSAKGVLRGMHFQRRTAQGKLITVLQGRIYDVMLDIRPHSAHFGQWFGITLEAASGQQLYIPPGFAHGFQALCDNTLISYKATEYYSAVDDAAFNALDPALAISWPITASLRSAKDSEAPSFADLSASFETTSL
ncbi:dTDP-4-dehydrorhamnose 3,5-epimerase [Alishewanella sp. d11]|uniref:dTDP-4-dehydrorhamnose 3,5-epimerase n=1 Tax=Alishewanella sp. d11 TaxID=3414030 RepID=UPI003BF905C4